MLLTKRLVRTHLYLCQFQLHSDIIIGETVTTGKCGRVHCFPYIPNDPVGPIRSDEQTREHARKAHLECFSVCVKHNNALLYMWHIIIIVTLGIWSEGSVSTLYGSQVRSCSWSSHGLYALCSSGCHSSPTSSLV